MRHNEKFAAASTPSEQCPSMRHSGGELQDEFWFLGAIGVLANSYGRCWWAFERPRNTSCR